MINYGYTNHQAKFIATRPILQTSLNLVIFGKNDGDFRREKDVSMNVKSQFINGGLYLLRLISWIVLCC